MIACRLDEKISDIIDKYVYKKLEHKENLKLIFESKKLNPSVTVKEVSLLNNSIIQIFDLKSMIEG